MYAVPVPILLVYFSAASKTLSQCTPSQCLFCWFISRQPQRLSASVRRPSAYFVGLFLGSLKDSQPVYAVPVPILLVYFSAASKTLSQCTPSQCLFCWFISRQPQRLSASVRRPSAYFVGLFLGSLKDSQPVYAVPVPILLVYFSAASKTLSQCTPSQCLFCWFISRQPQRLSASVRRPSAYFVGLFLGSLKDSQPVYAVPVPILLVYFSAASKTLSQCTPSQCLFCWFISRQPQRLSASVRRPSAYFVGLFLGSLKDSQPVYAVPVPILLVYFSAASKTLSQCTPSQCLFCWFISRQPQRLSASVRRPSAYFVGLFLGSLKDSQPVYAVPVPILLVYFSAASKTLSQCTPSQCLFCWFISRQPQRLSASVRRPSAYFVGLFLGSLKDSQPVYAVPVPILLVYFSAASKTLSQCTPSQCLFCWFISRQPQRLSASVRRPSAYFVGLFLGSLKDSQPVYAVPVPILLVYFSAASKTLSQCTPSQCLFCWFISRQPQRLSASVRRPSAYFVGLFLGSLKDSQPVYAVPVPILLVYFSAASKTLSQCTPSQCLFCWFISRQPQRLSASVRRPSAYFVGLFLGSLKDSQPVYAVPVPILLVYFSAASKTLSQCTPSQCLFCWFISRQPQRLSASVRRPSAYFVGLFLGSLKDSQPVYAVPVPILLVYFSAASKTLSQCTPSQCLFCWFISRQPQRLSASVRRPSAYFVGLFLGSLKDSQPVYAVPVPILLVYFSAASKTLSQCTPSQCLFCWFISRQPQRLSASVRRPSAYFVGLFLGSLKDSQPVYAVPVPILLVYFSAASKTLSQCTPSQCLFCWFISRQPQRLSASVRRPSAYFVGLFLGSLKDSQPVYAVPVPILLVYFSAASKTLSQCTPSQCLFCWFISRQPQRLSASVRRPSAYFVGLFLGSLKDSQPVYAVPVPILLVYFSAASKTLSQCTPSQCLFCWFISRQPQRLSASVRRPSAYFVGLFLGSLKDSQPVYAVPVPILLVYFSAASKTLSQCTPSQCLFCWFISRQPQRLSASVRRPSAYFVGLFLGSLKDSQPVYAVTMPILLVYFSAASKTLSQCTPSQCLFCWFISRQPQRLSASVRRHNAYFVGLFLGSLKDSQPVYAVTMPILLVYFSAASKTLSQCTPSQCLFCWFISRQPQRLSASVRRPSAYFVGLFLGSLT